MIINDSYGHQVGDECLKRFARALQTTFRPDDHVIRDAGDEFVIVAPALLRPDPPPH
ncbi:MAG: diguanylate cyclase [Acidobacteriota bacterium]|nr:diguanylate cyclase [Acidobacteriota bacterium]